MARSASPVADQAVGELLADEYREKIAERAAGRLDGGGVNAIRQVSMQLDKLGLPGLLGKAHALIGRASALGGEMARLRRDTQVDRNRLVERLAFGEISLAAVFDAAARYRLAEQPHGAVTTLAGNAVASLHSLAESEAWAAVPGIFKALQKAASEDAAESAKLVKSLGRGVESEAEARAVGAVEQWSRLGELVDHFVAVHGVAGDLRDRGWITPVNVASIPDDLPVNMPSVYLRYAAPARLPKGYSAAPPQLRLAAAVAAKAEPGLLPAEQATARYVSDHRAAEKRRLRRSGVDVGLL